MSFRGLILLVYILFLSTSLNAYERGNLVEVLAPHKNQLQTELTLNAVVTVVKGSIDYVKIITPHEEVIIDVNSSKLTYCKNLNLKYGENSLIFRSYKDGKIVDEKIQSMFVESELYYEAKYPPRKYKLSYFHNEKSEAQCKECHDMTLNEDKKRPFIDVKKSNCYKCHKSLTREKYAHAPAVNWICASCHNVNRTGKSKYLVVKPIQSVCFKCHENNYLEWSSAKYQHEPLDSGKCNKCHNSHSSPNRMFVRKPPNQICLGCHKQKTKHSQKSACVGVSTHKECVECHSPHAGNREFFLKDSLKAKR